jgi:hypothetical protein
LQEEALAAPVPGLVERDDGVVELKLKLKLEFEFELV